MSVSQSAIENIPWKTKYISNIEGMISSQSKYLKTSFSKIMKTYSLFHLLASLIFIFVTKSQVLDYNTFSTSF